MKNQIINKILRLATFVLAAYTQAPARADIIRYDPGLGSFPEAQGFTNFQTLSPPVPILTNGVFHQFPERNVPAYGYQYWYYDRTPLDFSTTPYALEATLRVISSNYAPDGGGSNGVQRSGYYLYLVDRVGRSFAIGLSSGGITIATDAATDPDRGGLPLTPFNTADAFHTYCFVVAGGRGALFIDGAFFASVTNGGPTRPDIANYVLFGDGSHAGVSETELRLLRFQSLALFIDDATVTEGNLGTTNAVFAVSLATNHSEILSVDFATVDGSATAGSDYLATSGTLIFNPGETYKTITVPVLGDVLDEGDETFFLRLSNPTNISLITTQAVGTILDDDKVPLSIAGVTVLEGNNGTTNAVFTLHLVRPHPLPVSVDFATTNGSAMSDADYIETSGAVTFAPGETDKNITVLVNGDWVDETNETFFVNLSHPVHAMLITARAQGTILDDDTALAITQQPANQTVRPGSTAIFRVSALSSFPPISYQWRFNGSNILDATNSTLTVTDVQFINAGEYSVLVVDSLSFVVSEAATLTVLAGIDYFTELFAALDNDLTFSTITFTPDGSASFYAPCREVAASFPTDPTGGTFVWLDDDDYIPITLAGINTVGIYNRRTNVFFIGSNGYLTVDSGDDAYGGSLSRHFDRPRVSALFDDFNLEDGGTVSWKQLSNRVAVTYQNVPHYDYGGANSFQIEMFFDGRIRLTYLALSANNGLAGLSAGQGVPAGFLESDLSSYGPCLVHSPHIALAPDGSGGFFFRFNGVTGFTYQLQRATNVIGPWIATTSITALAPGLVELHDTNAPPGSAFYRTVTAP